MALPQTAGLPPQMDLGEGYSINFEALSPTTGNAVAGVNVKSASIFATDLANAGAQILDSGPFLLVPGPGA